jgi:hypothetical protein
MLRNSKTDSRYATDLLTASGTFSRTASEASMEVRHHSFWGLCALCLTMMIFEHGYAKTIAEDEEVLSDAEDGIYINYNNHGRMALEMRYQYYPPHFATPYWLIAFLQDVVD